MDQELFEWLLLLVRWTHITTAIAWVGASIFFMWLDRSFVLNAESKRPGHKGELWMVHGGGFYHVEKLEMGPTKVPDLLHWFKWESYWTWLSGMLLVAMVFYVGNGIFLIDTAVSSISYAQGLLISLFAIFGSWFVYDFLWESSLTKKKPLIGHALTLAWLAGMAYFLCHTLSGRAAYLHVGAMLGTWMTANVFVRIIPRQAKMVKAAKNGEPLNADWPKNAKNRSTHNTYFTLPVIFIMLSNHFPMTYGHDYNWIVLLLMCAAGAAIREYFVVRLSRPARAKTFGLAGLALLVVSIAFTRSTAATSTNAHTAASHAATAAASAPASGPSEASGVSLKGLIKVEGDVPQGTALMLPPGCAQQHQGTPISDEVLVRDGRLKNALVRITKGHEDLPKGEVPTTPVEVDQRGCIYVPRMVVARVGQEVIFINSDPLYHNVRAFTKENAQFNDSMPQQGQRISKRFERQEVVLQTKCSVHPWMNANVAILDHPYYAISDADGQFEIKGLAPGSYKLEIWHEYYGAQTQDVTVGKEAGEPLTFTLRK